MRGQACYLEAVKKTTISIYTFDGFHEVKGGSPVPAVAPSRNPPGIKPQPARASPRSLLLACTLRQHPANPPGIKPESSGAGMLWFNSPSREALRQPKITCATRASPRAGGGLSQEVAVTLYNQSPEFQEIEYLLSVINHLCSMILGSYSP